jgi:hypothetical protein
MQLFHDFTGRLPGWVTNHLIGWAEYHQSLSTPEGERQFFIYHMLVGRVLYGEREAVN